MNKIVLAVRGCTHRLNRFELRLQRRCEKTSWYVLIALLVLTASMLGCTRPSKPVSRTSGVNIGGAITLEMWASSDCVQPEERVLLRATVTNETSRQFVVELKDQPVLDIWIGPDSAPLRWSDGKPLTADLTRLELKPGESKIIEMNWMPDPSIQGPILVSARFVYSSQFSPLVPGFNVNVKYCPGPLGP